MCGFVAVMGPGEPLARPLVECMRDQLAHRGPDGAGFWEGRHQGGSIALGFRRLAIIDTRSVADQPMLSQDGRLTMVFNGEIYNYVELRNELQAAGRSFVTRSDSEVLLQAYEHWGDAVVERLNGMFAFVIWDERRGQVFAARDRFGEKPMFISRLPGGRVAIASEIKALLAHPDADRAYDLDMFGGVLGGHLLFGTEQTLFGGVRQFPAGHCMAFSLRGEALWDRRYWAPAYDRSLAQTDLDELSERLLNHLERSLEMRMRSDVPVTACLSGGLDSSSLVTLLARATKGGSGTLRSAMSVRFPDDPTIDEGRFIDIVLRHTGLQGHVVSPTAADLMRDLRQMHWHHETIIPGPSMYLEWSLMRQARSLGYKVIIDGQGADEILAGYASYLQAYQVELAGPHLLGIVKARQLGKQRDARLRQAASQYANSSRRFSSTNSLPLRQYLAYHRRALPGRIKEYGGDGLPHHGSIGALRFDLAVNLMRTSLPSNLYSGDRNSMAHGIECRYPFLDYELVDFTTRLPDEAYLGDAWGKALLRKAMSGLMPDEITWRADKVGFAAPQDTWMSSPVARDWLRERIFDTSLGSIGGYSPSNMRRAWMQQESGVADHSSLLWRWASAAELLDMQRCGVWQAGANARFDTPSVGASNTDHVADYQSFDANGFYQPGTGEGNKTAWIISYTPVAKEPRVIRQAKALEQAGWRVVVFGLPGLGVCPREWHFVGLMERSFDRSSRSFFRWGRDAVVARLQRGARAAGAMLSDIGSAMVIRSLGARLNHWATPSYRTRRQTIESFFGAYPHLKPDLVLCHDYFTLDVAMSVGRKAGAPVSIDCHEYALGQYMHDKAWVRWHRPVVKAMQDDLFPQVDGLTTVCEGIAELIAKDHTLGRPALVVRSVPFYRPQKFRETGDVITVLYHGEIYRTRALHVAVRSLHLWRPEFRLVLRGYADPRYVAELRQIAAANGSADRLVIEPPVPFDQIITAANSADIGYFVHQDVSPQRRYALPNKFFEYVMAGLAVVVSDLPEMARLVKQHKFGSLVPECNEEMIVNAINGLDRQAIDRMKRCALEAAAELNWERESGKMMALYTDLTQ
jgi:asparagine synthase (glutamine-hydrolysing)